MKIFLSWSGKRSRETAEILRDWIPQVIQAVEPWLSKDIEKGKRWNKEISDNLEDSKVGIICLNRENLHEDWIHFEAGAISKTKDAYVCTFLLDLNPTDVEEPLAQFQHTLFNKEDIFKLIQTINKRLSSVAEKPLAEKTLENVFETFWPQFEKIVNKLLDKKTEERKPLRDTREMTEEILEILRKQERESRNFPSVVTERSLQAKNILKDSQSYFKVVIKGKDNNIEELVTLLNKTEYEVLEFISKPSKKNDQIEIKLVLKNYINVPELAGILVDAGYEILEIEKEYGHY